MIPSNSIITGFIYSTSLMAVSAGVDAPAHFGNAVMVDIGGVQVPVITSIFGLLGVLLARPLTPKRDPALARHKEIIVTIILSLVSVAWIVETQPRLLFTLIVCFGLGYSGFAIIELMGSEVEGLIKRAFAVATDFLDRFRKKDKP